MKKFAVIVAGGSGQRMGTAKPKQFLFLKEKPVLWYSISAFLNAFADIYIILVLPEEYIFLGEELKAAFKGKSENIQVIAGGTTRFQSVKNGLQLTERDSVVFVHDGVRCLVSKELIRSCYNQAITSGSAIPAIAATDSIRIVNGGQHAVADRNNVRIIQTPQTFLTKSILPAFEQEFDPAFTDEATVVEANGTPVFLIEGEFQNIKITRPIDLLIAEKILEERALSF
jgi:2-C-methyl-D-erythritol 4-phosphate cytidylyltransferase